MERNGHKVNRVLYLPSLIHSQRQDTSSLASNITRRLPRTTRKHYQLHGPKHGKVALAFRSDLKAVKRQSAIIADWQ